MNLLYAVSADFIWAMLGRTTGHGLSTLIVVCLVYWSLKPSATLIIDHSRYNYTTVPQNLTDQVTELLLSYNKINVIDNTSFVKYGRLKYIYLQHNNLEYIMPGTFDNNPHLKGLYLKFNDIKYLPPSFGPSAPFLEELDLGSAMKASVAEILRIQYLAQFSSLTFLRLRYIELFTLEDIFLPRPLQTLSIGNTELSTFPNVSADRLPDLEVLLVQGNLFHVIPEYLFSGISDSLHNFDISGGQLNVTPNFASKTELKVIDLRGNSLETQDDLLAELPKLKKIYLNKNSRWTCDKRLCWWRLWGRVRQEIKFDKPQCVNPAWTENYILPEINPKFMDCFNGRYGSKRCNSVMVIDLFFIFLMLSLSLVI